MEDDILTGVLEASIANPEDEFEVDLIADAASVGITDELYRGGKRIEWTEEMLSSAAQSLRGMPINLKEPDDDGKIEPHTNIVIGRVEDVSFDQKRGKLLATGKLWKHVFPNTMVKLGDMMKDEKKRPQVSIEFQPTKAELNGDVIKPLDGRFLGMGIVNKGADTGNFIHLLASAKEEDEKRKLDESKDKGVPLAGSFEWIGEQVITHLNASASTSDYDGFNVVATYPDRAIWYDNNTYYQIPYTIDRTSIKFGDTIEVEQDFKPVEASGTPDVSIVEPQKEAVKPMAEITDTELEALKASAKQAEDLAEELKTLKASAEEAQTKLADAEKKIADAEAEKETARLETLAASRLEEVEKIHKYDNAEERKTALETFKTMDESSYNLLKNTLQAAAPSLGGVAEGEPIRNPLESREDSDGAAAEFVKSEDFKKLVASASESKENV